MNLKIASNLSLPIEAALWKFAVLAISGAGKTYDAAVLAEEMMKTGIPIVVLDGIGVWWGLRVAVNKDGEPLEQRGLPVIIFGGKHADVNIPTKADRGRPIVDEEELKRMVKAILESHVSAVLDTKDFSKSMQRRIVTIFAEELYRLNESYGPRHVFIEEADMWCPQRVSHDMTQTVGAIDDLVRRGGNFNLGSTLISQRPAVVNKDVLSQIGCLIALRILAKNDKLAVRTWVESAAGEDQPKIANWYESLKTLKDGESWIWNPTAGLFKRVQFRKRETLHATREYFLKKSFTQGKVKVMPIDEIIQKFKNVFEPKPKEEKKKEHPKPIEVLRPEPRKIEPIHPEIPKPIPQPNPTTEEKPISKIHLDEHQLVFEVESHERIVRVDDESEKGMVIKVLSKAARPLSQVEIIQEAAEYGRYITAPSLSKHMSQYVAEGVIFQEGRQYRLPRFVRFDIKPDYYVDDSYLYWEPSEEEADQMEEEEARENECHLCGMDLREEACNQWPECQEMID